MCDLVSGLMMASAAVGAYGQIEAGNAQAQAAQMSAEINQRNALFAERRAMDAIMRGQEEEQRVRQEGHQLKGRQTVQMAAAGLDLSFGSPLDILVDTQIGMELDAMRTRRNAALEAEDFDRQAWSYRAQAGLDTMEASSARSGAMIGAVGTLVGGGANVARYRASIT